MLTSIDGVQNYDGLTLPVVAIPSENESSIDIILEVPFRRVLDVKVLAYDCQEHSLTKMIELGNNIIFQYDVHCMYPGEKDCANSWLQCEISCYLAVSAVACGLRSIAPGSLVTMSVIDCEKNGTMVFQR